MVGPPVLDHHVATGQAGRNQKRGHHQPVGDDCVGGGVQPLDSFDLDARGAGPGDPGAHRVEEAGQVEHLGLPAAFSMTVVPLARTAAMSTLSVPVWLGYSSTTLVPTSRPPST